MRPLRAGRTRWAYRVALGLIVTVITSASGQDGPEAKRQLEFMQAAVERLVPESQELKPGPPRTFASKPLFRYSDPTRGGVKETAANVLLDAGIWRLGTEGRPTALVTVEIYRAADGSRLLAYEFLSLTATKYSLKHKTESVRWDATGSALELKDLPDAPKPAATPAARLTQMRQLARRFAARERYKNESVECRLVTQPIDRYHSDAERISDGAVFALANGTNPEIGIVFESDGERWRYGVIRLCAAESSVTLDGQQVAAYEHYNAQGRSDGAYHNAAHKIEAEK